MVEIPIGLAEQNIAKLFAVAMVPGLIAMVGYMIAIAINVRMVPGHAPDNDVVTERITLQSLKGVVPIALIFLLVFGGIYGGLFAPTEGAIGGVMTPMKNGARSTKRAATLAAGKHTPGPAGYQEVGCATLSFYDAEAERLSTLRMARDAGNQEGDAEDPAGGRVGGCAATTPGTATRLVKLAKGALSGGGDAARLQRASPVP